MKRLLFVLPFLMLSACSPYSNDAIYRVNNLDNSLLIKDMSLIPATASDITNKIETGNEFILYIYSTTCTSCLEKTANLTQYAKDTSSTIYAMPAEEGQYVTLQHAYSDIFPYTFMPPLIYVFKNGKYVTLDANRLKTLDGTKNLFNQYQKKSKISTFNIVNSYNSVKSNSSFLLMNIASPVEHLFYTQYVFPLAAVSNKNTYLVNTTYANQNLINQIRNDYQVTNIDNLVVCVNDNNFIVKDYSVNPSDAIALVNQYFQN